MSIRNKMLLIPIETKDLSTEMYLFPDLCNTPQAEILFDELGLQIDIIDTFQKEGEFFTLNSCAIQKKDNETFLKALNRLAERIDFLGFGEELNRFSEELYQRLKEELGEQQYN